MTQNPSLRLYLCLSSNICPTFKICGFSFLLVQNVTEGVAYVSLQLPFDSFIAFPFFVTVGKST